MAWGEGVAWGEGGSRGERWKEGLSFFFLFLKFFKKILNVK